MNCLKYYSSGYKGYNWFDSGNRVLSIQNQVSQDNLNKFMLDMNRLLESKDSEISSLNKGRFEDKLTIGEFEWKMLFCLRVAIIFVMPVWLLIF